MSSILEGVDENTTRATLLDRLREAAKRLTEKEDKRVGRLQEIEERVRRKFAGTQESLVQIIATSTEQEWATAVDFLDNFEDILPVALCRIHDGAKIALGRTDPVAEAAATEKKPEGR